MYKSIFACLLLICTFSNISYSQQIKEVTPTQEEQERLAKLRLRITLSKTQMQVIETQIFALQQQKVLKSQEVNKNVNDLNNAVDVIKTVHTDWGKKDKIIYNVDEQGKEEYGQFVVDISDEKEKIKDGKENVEQKGQEKERGKILEKKPK